MAIDNPVHVNECGLPLNAIEWLETHHLCKLVEREQMIHDLSLARGSSVVDAGCGPGLWTPLLAKALGPQGRIIGVDVSAEALVTARQRSRGQPYEEQVSYQQSSMECLPVPRGSIHTVFSANVSQYLPEPVQTFAALGRYLMPGGRLVVKDIDFGTMRFYNVDLALQARVFQARERWEEQRFLRNYTFEDSWVGSKLAGYLRAAGYENVQERYYKIARQAPLTPAFRFYIQGIGRWFVCEDAPFLSKEDVESWLSYFIDNEECVCDQETFGYEETEFVVTGSWPG
jgi:ubiquinone/menaquinone biosynthesis C-methylase UbiE